MVDNSNLDAERIHQATSLSAEQRVAGLASLLGHAAQHTQPAGSRLATDTEKRITDN